MSWQYGFYSNFNMVNDRIKCFNACFYICGDFLTKKYQSIRILV